MIKEIIVVEGRDDVRAVKEAVEAEIIAVHGFGITKDSFDRIRRAAKERGVIVLTDPDHAGEAIRRRIEEACPGVLHAYINRQDGTKGDDVGVENASADVIRQALLKAKASQVEARQEFTVADLLEDGFMGGAGAKERRQNLGKLLGIGYANSGVLLSRLNHYGISRQEYDQAVERLDEEN